MIKEIFASFLMTNTSCHLRSLRERLGGVNTSASPAPKFMLILSLPLSSRIIQWSVLPATNSNKALESLVRNLKWISVELLASFRGIDM